MNEHLFTLDYYLLSPSIPDFIHYCDLYDFIIIIVPLCITSVGIVEFPTVLV